MGDTPNGTLLLHHTADQEFAQITHSTDIPDGLHEPDQYRFSINLIAHDNREDRQRCIEALVRYRAESSFEIVVLDNGSSDDTLGYLQVLARHGTVSYTHLDVYKRQDMRRVYSFVRRYL